MGPLNIVLAILLFASAIFLIIAVLIQSGKSKGVSGAIAGGASETYFGKNKGKSRDKQLSLLTTIVAIVFAVLALITYVTQDYIEPKDPITTTTTAKLPTSTKAPVSSGSSSDKVEDTDDALPEDGDATTDSSDATTDSSDATTDSSDATTDSSDVTTDSSDVTTDSSEATIDPEDDETQGE